MIFLIFLKEIPSTFALKLLLHIKFVLLKKQRNENY